MIQDRDILVVGLQSFDSEIGSNCVNIAHEFSVNNRVLYVNYALDRLSMYRSPNHPLIIKRKEVLAGKRKALQQISDNLWNMTPALLLEPVNGIRPHFLFNMLNKKNARKFASAIKNHLEKLDFTDLIIFNDSDFYRSFYLKEQLNPKTYLYYTRDNMVATDYFKRHGLYYESRLMQKADAVVANSVYLKDHALQFNTNSFYVGQGCDLELFNPRRVKEKPVDMQNIPNPVIGYIGALKSARLDISLLEEICREKPGWNLVLVGPEDEVFKKSVLHQMSNVYFLGSKPLEELPTYIKYFDVAINPQAVNELTIGNYPRKIDEYLAIGRPSVATQTRAMSIFEDYVYLADGNAADYISCISRALQENADKLEEERIRFAQNHSWENSVKEIYKVIEQIEEKQNSTE
ncbi:MAG: glycosyltransferase [Bacteroidales bacterium]|nr:glycosyltransferase [Bacteroidales bacterium]MCF8399012.1 glycosyltransferase [Bacteroidales bacterium]